MIRNLLLLSFLLIAIPAIAEDPKTKPKAAADKTKAELIAELKATRAREKRLADALEKLAEMLGGEARLGVTPEKIRKAKPADVEQIQKRIERIDSYTGAIDIYRKQIKTVEEQLAKAKDQLDAVKETNAKLRVELMQLKVKKK